MELSKLSKGALDSLDSAIPKDMQNFLGIGLKNLSLKLMNKKNRLNFV